MHAAGADFDDAPLEQRLAALVDEEVQQRANKRDCHERRERAHGLAEWDTRYHIEECHEHRDHAQAGKPLCHERNDQEHESKRELRARVAFVQGAIPGVITSEREHFVHRAPPSAMETISAASELIE